MPRRKHYHKLQGEWAEVCFLARAVGMGMMVSKPYGDSGRYDFIVDSGGRLSRVQVKSVSTSHRQGYRIATSHGNHAKRGYRASEIDLLAAYIIPMDTWYIIPVYEFESIVSVWVWPGQGGRGRFEKYREAWRLLKGAIAA